MVNDGIAPFWLLTKALMVVGLNNQPTLKYKAPVPLNI